MLDRAKLALELNNFFKLFCKSLNGIPEIYFRTIYERFFILKEELKGRGKFNGEDFVRYGERVFCYELYHQLRKRLESSGNNFTQGVWLQGEVEKIEFAEFVGRLKLDQLDKEYIPDFLVHSPGNTNHHHYVIEVKCNPDVSKEAIWEDLFKINEFLIKYRYKRGIFLTVNATPSNIENRLMKLTDRVKELRTRQIFFLCKEDKNSQTLGWNWGKNNWQIINR